MYDMPFGVMPGTISTSLRYPNPLAPARQYSCPVAGQWKPYFLTIKVFPFDLVRFEDIFRLGLEHSFRSEIEAEVIEDGHRTHDLPFKLQTIDELRILLACTDAEIDRVIGTLIRIDPTADVEEPLNWGSHSACL